MSCWIANYSIFCGSLSWSCGPGVVSEAAAVVSFCTAAVDSWCQRYYWPTLNYLQAERKRICDISVLRYCETTLSCFFFKYVSHWSGIQHRQRRQRTRNLLVLLIRISLFQKYSLTDHPTPTLEIGLKSFTELICIFKKCLKTIFGLQRPANELVKTLIQALHLY